MSGSLGEKIGSGATADVHAWASGRVVKLFKSGIPRLSCVHEMHVMRALRAADVSAPEVFDEVAIDGRFGFVMSRLDGPSLMDAIKRGVVTYAQAGSTIAACLHTLHRTPPPNSLPRLHDYLAHCLETTSHSLPPHVIVGIVERVGVPSPDDCICHGDANPGNVMWTHDGPVLIDWPGVTVAPAAFDLASAHVLLTELAPLVADDPDRPRSVDDAVQAEYAAQAGLSTDELAAMVTPYLPVVRALALLKGFIPALGDVLARQLASDFAE